MNTANFLSIPSMMFPDQEILVFDGNRFTYGQALDRVRRLAASLRALGVKPGDRVATLQTNSNQFIESYYATATLGATFVPLNYRAKQPEIEYMVTAADVKVLFIGSRYVDVIKQLQPKFTSVTHYVSMEARYPDMLYIEDLIDKGSSEDIEDAEVDESDVSILMYTSGTTSLPKGVMLTYGDFTNYVVGTVEMADGTERGTSLLCAPLYHIAGTANIMTAIWAGRKIVILRQFEPKDWLKAVHDEKITHAFVVPTMMKQLIDHPEFPQFDMSSLQNLSYGGAPMPFPVIRKAIESFPKGTGFVNAFGQTETTSTLTVLGPEDHRLDGPAAEVERNLKRLTSVGKPLPDVEVQIFDEENKPIAANEIGEVVIRTPRIMKGYAGQESATAALLDVDGWLHTRDMGYLDDDGYVYLVGRKDDIIIRGGENIAPAEIEAVLHAHPAIDEAAVIGVPDVDWGQKIAAFVALRPGKTVSSEELSEFCRQRLASFKKPELIRFVDALPKNPLGKVLKKELKAEFVE
ncbi:MAG: long-chain-fatty-acid--CoA ligase [Deltaproteobacteria bacterium]|nr:long-chain-fatty-acid--CoA ligase [Deltaproteobacteria bacterium]